eukprot:GHVS01015828.1.p1 GENE.GHVS01015828.1~~GHVS01015828.1.p1  ORF type:complete len:319 (+),score=14.72 GHVS01015828.1:72-1028(+)
MTGLFLRFLVIALGLAVITVNARLLKGAAHSLDSASSFEGPNDPPDGMRRQNVSSYFSGKAVCTWKVRQWLHGTVCRNSKGESVPFYRKNGHIFLKFNGKTMKKIRALGRRIRRSRIVEWFLGEKKDKRKSRRRPKQTTKAVKPKETTKAVKKIKWKCWVKRFSYCQHKYGYTKVKASATDLDRAPLQFQDKLSPIGKQLMKQSYMVQIKARLQKMLFDLRLKMDNMQPTPAEKALGTRFRGDYKIYMGKVRGYQLIDKVKGDVMAEIAKIDEKVPVSEKGEQSKAKLEQDVRDKIESIIKDGEMELIGLMENIQYDM